MNSSCLVVDDEVLAREGIEAFILQTPFLDHVSSFGSAEPTLHFLKNHTVDLLFLDIQMPEMTGLELIKKIENPPQVIFTTAYREFAIDGFELNAVDYLLKPISYDRFLKAAKKAVAAQSEKRDHIFIKSNGMIIKILLDTILYIESAKDYIFIHTTNNKYLTLISLRQIELSLPGSKFMRVHRSYLIALKQVERIEGHQLHIGEQRIPISRPLREEVYKRIIGNRLIER